MTNSLKLANIPHLIHTLPKNTSLYRGSKENNRGKEFVYFVHGDDGKDIVNREYLRDQGSKTREYKTLRELTLLKMDSVDTIKTILSILGENLISFKINKSGEIVLRNSEKERNNKVSKKICKLVEGIDGYITERMGTFHPEIMLCKTEDMLCKTEDILSEPKEYQGSVPPSAPKKPARKGTFTTPSTARILF